MNINLVCSCCLAGDGDVTRTQEILCYPPCVLCPVYLVSAGIFITREDSVRYCHKLHRTPTIDDALVCAHIVCKKSSRKSYFHPRPSPCSCCCDLRTINNQLRWDKVGAGLGWAGWAGLASWAAANLYNSPSPGP